MDSLRAAVAGGVSPSLGELRRRARSERWSRRARWRLDPSSRLASPRRRRRRRRGAAGASPASPGRHLGTPRTEEHGQSAGARGGGTGRRADPVPGSHLHGSLLPPGRAPMRARGQEVKSTTNNPERRGRRGQSPPSLGGRAESGGKPRPWTAAATPSSCRRKRWKRGWTTTGTLPALTLLRKQRGKSGWEGQTDDHPRLQCVGGGVRRGELSLKKPKQLRLFRPLQDGKQQTNSRSVWAARTSQADDSLGLLCGARHAVGWQPCPSSS